MSTYPVIANKIKSVREKYKLSQERFAKKLGLTSKAVSAYETGRCEPPLKVLENISNVYQVPLLYFGADFKSTLENKIKNIKESIIVIEEMMKEYSSNQ